MNTIFREYDIRGIVDKELTEKSCKLIGYFLGTRIKKVSNYVVIGYDARLHSHRLFEYLTSGLNKAAVKVINVGMVPTPVVYFCNYNKLDGIETNSSIVITGSHNPKEYNGFKITIDKKPFFGDDIYELAKEIENNIDINILDDTTHTSADVKPLYVDYMVSQFSHLKKLNLNIALDAGNGTAGVVVSDIFDKLKLTYKPLFFKPDGTFPNHHPDPSEDENLEDLKRELSGDSDIAFGYDGDSDRVAVLTKKRVIKGDILAILLARSIDNPTVIGEVKCSDIMYKEIDKIGRAIMYKTGHSNLKVKIRQESADLAAEVSGHIFFADRYFGFDDAIYATLRVLELCEKNVDLDEEIDNLPQIFSTEEIKYKTKEDKKFKIIENIKDILKSNVEDMDIKDLIEIDGVRVVFSDGWALVRASNTTPTLVLRMESTKKSNIAKYENYLYSLIEQAENRI
jgi:phosphomannomutase/phosphoglucomutase